MAAPPAAPSAAPRTWLGVRAALWIMLGIAAASGSVLLTSTFRGRRDLPVSRPASRATARAARSQSCQLAAEIVEPERAE